MPIYDYECRGCGNVFDMNIKMDERKVPCSTPCEDCGGEIVQCITKMNIADPVRIGVRRPSEEFKQVLTQIHESNPKSNLNQKLSQNPRPKTSL